MNGEDNVFTLGAVEHVKQAESSGVGDAVAFLIYLIALILTLCSPVIVLAVWRVLL